MPQEYTRHFQQHKLEVRCFLPIFSRVKTPNAAFASQAVDGMFEERKKQSRANSPVGGREEDDLKSAGGSEAAALHSMLQKSYLEDSN